MTEIHSAVEACAFFSNKLVSVDVAFDMGFLSKLYLVAREDVAMDGTINVDVASMDVAAAFYTWHEAVRGK